MGLDMDGLIEEIAIFGGVDKSGEMEKVREVYIRRSEIVGVVGPTGSGKSSLIEDIEQLAQGDTSTRRIVLVNGKRPDYENRTNPKKKIVAQLSQNMNFLANMIVEDFLKLHTKCRQVSEEKIDEVIFLANNLTGEPVGKQDELTALSGGQSRALMVADMALISDSPVVLVDEIENAGIKKYDAMQVLAGHGKIVLVVTHDPVLALMAKRRIVMKNGGMWRIIETSAEEKKISGRLNHLDEWILDLREKVRQGNRLEKISLFAGV